MYLIFEGVDAHDQLAHAFELAAVLSAKNLEEYSAGHTGVRRVKCGMLPRLKREFDELEISASVEKRRE